MEQMAGDQAVTRRDALKKAAVAGAAVAWAAPTVQFLGQGVAGAQGFASTCASCVPAISVTTSGDTNGTGLTVQLGFFQPVCRSGALTPGDPDITWAVVGDTAANNFSAPFTDLTGFNMSGATHDGSGIATATWTATVTWTCTCFGDEVSDYSCAVSGSASWDFTQRFAQQPTWGTAAISSNGCSSTPCP